MSQAEFKRRLKALMLKPENQVCSDCPERQPRWASLIVPPPGAPAGSLPMGAFCCLECSGSHRRLGVHISFVRSINLDQWKEKEVLAMENGGNAKVNAIFEAHLNVAKPNNSASGPVRERFIRDKYERRKFYDPRVFESAAQMNNGGGQDEEEEEAVIAGVQRRLASERGTRAPSDAARRRVEERAAKNRSGGGINNSPTRSKPVKAPVPVAPEPVVDLLDFGDFTSVEAASSFGHTNTTSIAPAIAVATPAPSATPPAPPAAVDMFANISLPVQNATAPPQQQQQQQQQQQPEKKTMSNADILSMFNTPNPQHNPMQQNMFPMQNGGMLGGMGGGNNMMMMMNASNSNNMGMMNQQQMGMNNMGMGGNMNQMMGMQSGMGLMNQQQPMGMTNMMGGSSMNQMMMMQQHPQQNQMHQMNMMGGNNMMMQGGGMMQGGNQFGSPMGQAQQQRGGGSNNVDQFADFGNFGR